MLLDQIMPAYYFAMEGYNAGEKHDPAVDTLLTIQYQKIDLTTGEPLGALTILKEWESSEQSIVTTFYNQFFKPDLPVTHFIPVGMNLDYEFELFLAKVKKYDLPAISSHHLYYKRPRFDLWSIIVLLNDGRFTGARLDAFSPKKFDESHMKKWYEKKDFKKIEHYIREETEGFLKLLQYLTKYKTRLGITKKVAAFSEDPEPMTPPARTERSLPAHPKYPENEKPSTRSRDDTRTSAPRNSSSRAGKSESPSSSKYPAKSRDDTRTSAPRNSSSRAGKSESPSSSKYPAKSRDDTRTSAPRNSSSRAGKSESPSSSKYPARNRDDTRAPAPRKSSARIGKAEPSASRSSSGRSKSEGQRTSVPLSQLRKHTPTKDSKGRKTAGRRA
ncbi:MAG: hypothetical protein WCH85_06460 [Methanomicrobiales archaeon]